MLAILYLLLIAALAGLLQSRVALLESFRGTPRYLAALGLTLFLATWLNLLLFAVAGAGQLYLRLSWGLPVLALCYWSGFWRPGTDGSTARSLGALWTAVRDVRSWNPWFLCFAAFVVVRFYVGLDIDEENNVWSTFNFVDSAFHLSVVNAFLAAPHFPPVDLDMAPFPLKYHFLADFHVAHLARLGLPALSGLWLMNVVSALVMVGTLWAAFERWLRLPPRWIMLAGFVFLFLNTALLNLLHYLSLHPRFFDPDNLFYGLLRFPYFNFEASLANMLEPQRGLLFSLPIALLVLHAAFGDHDNPGTQYAPGRRTLEAFVLVCLLPLSHIVAFAVMAPVLLPALWRHRGWLLGRWWIWLPAFALGLLQLLYLRAYGPPANAAFAAWFDPHMVPVQDFAALPAFVRRIAFWFFADGDFLFWGVLFAALAYLGRRDATGDDGLWPFLRRWAWYFAVCGLCFGLINVYRYSFDWGDSNKFVFFVNLGLTLVIVLGAARWLGGRRRQISDVLWAFFLVLSLGAPCYSFYDNVLASGHGDGTVLLFEKNGRRAADWIRETLPVNEVILTAAYNTFHFVTPLAGRPTLAGIYGDSNPYRQDDRAEKIRRIYEQGEFARLRELKVGYVCVSRNERRKYQLSPRWLDLMKSGTAAFQAGEGPQDYHSVYLFEVAKLPAE